MIDMKKSVSLDNQEIKRGAIKKDGSLFFISIFFLLRGEDR